MLYGYTGKILRVDLSDERITEEKLDEAHKKDLAVQGKYGVEITDYWHSEKDGAVFCLAKAPTKEAFGAVHREAHGLEADEIIEVRPGEK
jgi:aldehyde:ferredoxin oxidoreductase